MHTIRQITSIVKGTLVQLRSDDAITRLAFDSRKIIEPANALFFAIKGKRNDGHQYLHELYRKGVRNFVVTKTEIDTEKIPDANIIKVENAIAALQQLAAFHRRTFSCPVIGITGSNGKTIVKEWLFQLLKDECYIVRSPKS